jgi:putative AbiEii toxin of type IV toxin-antitoxin system
MANETLKLKNIGPITEADVQFGDLTILVGPQATGKSIFFQFLRLVLDVAPILGYLDEHGLNWHRDTRKFLELYLGEGTGGVWQHSRSQIFWQGQPINLDTFLKSRKHRGSEKSFLIPAQRVMAFSRDGWFRPFNDYRPGDPFSIRDFSEKLRRWMESEGVRNGAIYPQPRKLKAEIRELLSKNIFGGFQLELDESGPQKRLVLHGHGTQIPYMVWSAGQREFVPLLLGLYSLLPSTRPKRLGSVEWVMIEELEMGLHPQAISSMFFIVLELLWRCYRVCLSTHSPHVLDLVWAFRNLRDHNANPKKILSFLDVKCTPSTIKLIQAALKKLSKVYYFDPQARTTHDISILDPSATEMAESGWGGLTELSGRLADLVADAVASNRLR